MFLLFFNLTLFHLIYNGFYVSDGRGVVTGVVDSCLQKCPNLEK